MWYKASVVYTSNCIRKLTGKHAIFAVHHIFSFFSGQTMFVYTFQVFQINNV